MINPFKVLAGQSSDNSESDFWSTLKPAFDIAKGGWDVFDTIFSLFKKDYDAAKAEIIAAIKETNTNTWENEATSVINDYSLLLEVYSTDKANLFLSKSSSVVSQLEGIIRDENSWNAYLAAKPYNFVVPLRASVMKLEGQSDYEIKKLLNAAIETNKRFLGEYVFKDLPNIPQYDNRTTFSSCIIPPQGEEALPKECHELAPGEFEEFQEFIWQVNEDYRRQTIDHYYEQWFHIENLKEKGRCLKAKDSKLYLPICNSDDKSLLWQFNYSGRNEFELRHWSKDPSSPNA